VSFSACEQGKSHIRIKLEILGQLEQERVRNICFLRFILIVLVDSFENCVCSESSVGVDMFKTRKRYYSSQKLGDSLYGPPRCIF